MIAICQLVKTFVISVPGNVFEIAAILRNLLLTDAIGNVFVMSAIHMKLVCNSCYTQAMFM